MAVTAPASTSAPAARPARLWPAGALVALTLVVTLESFRLVFPHLYGLKERSGLVTVLVVFLAVAASPFLAVLLSRLAGGRGAAVGGVGLLAVWRAVAQFLGGWVPAVAGAVVALVALTLVLTAPLPGGPRARRLGFLAGMGLDLVLLGAFLTWDPAWQDGPVAVVVGLVLAAALFASGAVVFVEGRKGGEAASSPTFSGGVALGALVALEFMFLANSAYLAAASGVGLGPAVLISVACVAGALVLAGSLPSGSRVAAGVGAVLLVAAGLLLPAATGMPALALMLAAQLGGGLLASRALAAGDRGPVRAGAGLALGFFVGLVGILLYQLHYDRPLPVDNRYITAFLGLITVLALVGRRRPEESARRRGGLVGAAALLLLGLIVGGLVAAFTPDVAAEAADGEFRVVQWNIRQAVGEDGVLDPAVVAAAIEEEQIAAEGRVIVVLNEVARGWPLSGQLDLATWLSYRLGMHLVWGPASGSQFGNAVLSRFPVVSSEVVTLSHWGSYQGRSVVEARFNLGRGREVSVLGTHLQHRNDPAAHAVRLEEIDEILEHWAGAPATLLVGDLNPMQGDAVEGYPPRVPGQFEEIATLLAAGFTYGGNLEACEPATSNDNCSDFILTGPGLTTISYSVGDNFGDHRMLVAGVTVP